MTAKQRIKTYKEARKILEKEVEIDNYNNSFLCGLFQHILKLPEIDSCIEILPEFAMFKQRVTDEFFTGGACWFNVWPTHLPDQEITTKYRQLERFICLDLCILMAEEELLRQPAERVSWEAIKADMKYPKSDNNNGLIFGLYLYDNSMGLDEDGNEQWQDICDVLWFASDEERQNYIIDNDLRIVFDE